MGVYAPCIHSLFSVCDGVRVLRVARLACLMPVLAVYLRSLQQLRYSLPFPFPSHLALALAYAVSLYTACALTLMLPDRLPTAPLQPPPPSCAQAPTCSEKCSLCPLPSVLSPPPPVFRQESPPKR